MTEINTKMLLTQANVCPFLVCFLVYMTH